MHSTSIQTVRKSSNHISIGLFIYTILSAGARDPWHMGMAEWQHTASYQKRGNTARISFSHSAYASAKAGLLTTITMLVGRFVSDAAPRSSLEGT